MREQTLDFETASHADLKEVGAWRYSEDVTTEILCLRYKFKGVNQINTWVPGDSTDELQELAENSGIIFIAHNAGFEKAIWRNIMVKIYGLPDIPNSRWDDTLAMCAMRSIPLDLDHSTLALRLPNRKDKEGSTFTKKMSKPNRKGYYDRSPEALQRVIDYCGQDVLAEEDLRERLGPLPPGERNVWLLDQRINERGVLLDLPFVKMAQQIVDLASVPLVAEFKEITGVLPTQVAKFKDWILTQGVFVDSLNKEALAELLGEDPDDEDIMFVLAGVGLPPNVRRALYIRSLVGSASVKKLRRMALCVCMDGRARGLLQYHGAGPGRWAGRLLQPQNFPRGTLTDATGNKFDADYLVPLIMTGDPEQVKMFAGKPVETIVSSLRHAIVAAPGRTLLSGDFAGVECRFVLALSGQYDKVEIMASGKNIYCDMGLTLYKREIDKKKDLQEYTISKNSVLGLGFQMGVPKFKLKYAQNMSLDEVKELVRVYREDWAPCVPKVWRALDEASLETVLTGKPHEAYGVLYELQDRWLTARLPSGRKLWYFNPHSSKEPMPWDETDIRMRWRYQQMKSGQFKTIKAFGGLMTENVIQGLARDLMVNAMFKLEQNGFPIILTVHDEIVCEPMAKDADEKAFQQIMEDIPLWAKQIRMPVAVETWCGNRYRK